METYFFPIKQAFITFPIIAFFLTTPFLIYQYRKYGYINKLRAFILYSFLLYLITAYYLVILPLPRTRDVKSLQRPDTVHYNLKPLEAVRDIIRETRIEISNPRTYKYLFTERAFLQLAFNILLLLPLGVYLRYYFKRSLKQTVIISFMVSLFFEITQLTGLYGIYNAPYRLFDVDDLFLNTLGGSIGYAIAPIFTFFLPDAKSIDEKVELANLKVGFVRRFLAFSIDIAIVSLIPYYDENILVQIGSFLAYFVLIPYFTNGSTVGSWLTSFKIKGREDKLRFKEVLTRNGLFYFFLYGVNIIFNNLINLNEFSVYQYYLVIIVVLQLIYNIGLGLNLVIAIVKGDLFFYEKVSGTHLIISKD